MSILLALIVVLILPVVTLYSLFVEFFFEVLDLFLEVEDLCIVFQIIRLSVLKIFLSSKECGLQGNNFALKFLKFVFRVFAFLMLFGVFYLPVFDLKSESLVL